MRPSRLAAQWLHDQNPRPSGRGRPSLFFVGMGGKCAFAASASHSCRNVGSRHRDNVKTELFAAPPQVGFEPIVTNSWGRYEWLVTLPFSKRATSELSFCRSFVVQNKALTSVDAMVAAKAAFFGVSSFRIANLGIQCIFVIPAAISSHRNT